MVLEGFVVWVWCLMCLELLSVKFVATQLALVLTLILVMVVLLLAASLDLLGLFIGSTYSSVFVAVSLLALQFGPFWMPAVRGSEGVSGLRFWFFLIVATLGGGYVSWETSAGGWGMWILWQDLVAEVSTEWELQSGLLHWFFFRCFILETVGLNLYLFLGLVGVVMLLTARWLVVENFMSGEGRGGLRFERVRVVARVRRQTRRSNTSQIRHRG